ncbi:MAG: hypothetical protein C0506_04585 [Anaerolinea sp.]|nr:hypothetical protein [Anaerolinea sp.]
MNAALFHAINGLAGEWGAIDAAGKFIADPLRDLLVVAVFAVPLLRMRVEPRRAVMAIAVALIALLVANELTDRLKQWLDVARPFVAEDQVNLLVSPPPTAAMPSGHASSAGAAAMAGSLSWPRLAPYFWAAAGLVALGRVFVGVHYPLDVVAGLALGSAVALAAWWGAKGVGRLAVQKTEPRP